MRSLDPNEEGELIYYWGIICLCSMVITLVTLIALKIAGIDI